MANIRTKSMNGKKNARQAIQNIVNHFRYLNLEEINDDLCQFVNDNVEYFMSLNRARYSVEDTGFTIESFGSNVELDGSFKMSFEPSLVAPLTIKIVHTSLGGNHRVLYKVNFANKKQDAIAITYQTSFAGIVVTALKRETIYISGKKRFSRVNQHAISLLLDEQHPNYSQTDTSCYSSLDNSYVHAKKTISDDTKKIHNVYEKFDGENVRNKGG